MQLVFDIETNGLLDREDLKIHCVVARDVETDGEYVFRPHQIDQALELLGRADTLVGHNIAGFDLPVLERLHAFKYAGEIIDTLAVARMAYISCIEEVSEHIPYPLRHKFSLEAWGYRLKLLKGDYAKRGADVWEEFDEDMLRYCQRDVELNKKLYTHLCTQGARPGWPPNSRRSMLNESKVAYILGVQERNGVGFDIEGAERLEVKLQHRQQDLHRELSGMFNAWIQPKTGQNGSSDEVDRIAYHMKDSAPYSVSKISRTLTKHVPWPVCYRGGCAHTAIEHVEFNPGSGMHIAHVLKRDYGWVPEDFTQTGRPKTDEQVLSQLDYPAAKVLLEYALLKKRISAIQGSFQKNGKRKTRGWIQYAEKGDGVIHGRVHATGARTTRMSHFAPNAAQVPASRSPYGKECRALFKPTRPGWVMVGADASGLELRCLASRLAKFDGGDLAKTVVEADLHSAWQKLTGITDRDNQKTFNYAFLYGAGKRRLGGIIAKDLGITDTLSQDPDERAKELIKLGGRARKKLIKGLPALGFLLEQLKMAVDRGYIKCLDGRVIACPSEHGAINDLLQSDGAIVMKHALVILWDAWQMHDSARPMLNVHDEFQWECAQPDGEPHLSHHLGESIVQSIRDAGKALKMRCPMDGEFKVGRHWGETH